MLPARQWNITNQHVIARLTNQRIIARLTIHRIRVDTAHHRVITIPRQY